MSVAVVERCASGWVSCPDAGVRWLLSERFGPGLDRQNERIEMSGPGLDSYRALVLAWTVTMPCERLGPGLDRDHAM
jgi:hypothetical protein